MLKKIVLTGAAGRLGSICRGPLSKMCEALLSTDQVDSISDLAANETYVQADVGYRDQIEPLLEGAEMVVHFGSIADEAPWEQILHSNILSAHHIWDGAYKAGVRRIVFASSIHAVGMHSKHDFIGTDAPHRPDTYYGLAKCFTEDLATLFWEKRGLETVSMRILSCSGEVGNSRAVGSWLSDGDLLQLVQKSITAPTVGHTIVYGVSNNDRATVDNSKASALGYRPTDNAEVFAAEVFANAPPQDPKNPEDMCQGGPFAVVPLGESGVEMIRKRSVQS